MKKQKFRYYSMASEIDCMLGRAFDYKLNDLHRLAFGAAAFRTGKAAVDSETNGRDPGSWTFNRQLGFGLCQPAS